MYHSPTNSTDKASCKTKKEREENVVEMNPTLLKQQATSTWQWIYMPKNKWH